MPPAASALDGPTGSGPPAGLGALSSSISSTGNVERYHAGTPTCDAALWLRADAASAAVAASPDGDSGEEIKSEGGRELGGELEPRSLCARSALPSCGPIGRCGLATTSSSCHAQTDGPWPPRPDGCAPQNWPAHRLLASMQPSRPPPRYGTTSCGRASRENQRNRPRVSALDASRRGHLPRQPPMRHCAPSAPTTTAVATAAASRPAATIAEKRPQRPKVLKRRAPGGCARVPRLRGDVTAVERNGAHLHHPSVVLCRSRAQREGGDGPTRPR